MNRQVRPEEDQTLIRLTCESATDSYVTDFEASGSFGRPLREAPSQPPPLRGGGAAGSSSSRLSLRSVSAASRIHGVDDVPVALLDGGALHLESGSHLTGLDRELA